MNRHDINLIVAALTMLFLVPLIAVTPIFTIWSIQILFRSENLEINLESWCAALWLMTVLNGIKIGTYKF
jgi:hypothetical protein